LAVEPVGPAACAPRSSFEQRSIRTRDAGLVAAIAVDVPRHDICRIDGNIRRIAG
jgi:hypothetical protein